MKIVTCYTVLIKSQLVPVIKNDRSFVCHAVNDNLMKTTSNICLSALKFCVEIFLKEWDYLKTFPTVPGKGITHRKRIADLLIHTTKDNIAKYPKFDNEFPNFPSYMRRAVIADALGIVSSYVSNRENWEALSPVERGEEPKLGIPERYELTFYEQERDLCDLNKGTIGLKLYSGKEWNWYYFKISPSDAKYINSMRNSRKMLSPVVEKIRGKYQIRFSFEEEKELVQDKHPEKYRILAVDLGINAAASWCIMEKDGTVHGKGVIHLSCEEDRLRHMMNRKRMYQQEGKKSRSVYRMVTNANKRLSIETSRKLMEIAVLYDVDCIVFEHLDTAGKKKGSFKERIHMWRARDVQKRIELQAHRCGMRISRVCAWGTSKYAFDGSGQVLRGKDAGLDNYSICRFQNGKIYNCDLSASMNIGARFFLRIMAKANDKLILPKTPQRTYSTLIEVLQNKTA